MSLSEWPSHFLDDNRKHDSHREIVLVIFEAGEVFIKAKSSKAIGLSEDEDGEIFTWIPKSQINGDVPKKGEWIESGVLRIPRWLADDKGLDYESYE